MTKKPKQLIKNLIFIAGLFILIAWLIIAFIFRNTIGLTGNPAFMQVQIQMLPASIGVILLLSVAIENLSLLSKVVLIALIAIIASYILYFGLGLLLISIYGFTINWS